MINLFLPDFGQAFVLVYGSNQLLELNNFEIDNISKINTGDYSISKVLFFKGKEHLINIDLKERQLNEIINRCNVIQKEAFEAIKEFQHTALMQIINPDALVSLNITVKPSTEQTAAYTLEKFVPFNIIEFKK